MIKRLRRKFVLVIMAVVTVILLAIFFTLLISTQNNNERMSVGMLQQALNNRLFSHDNLPLQLGNTPPPPRRAQPNMRIPVLIISLDNENKISAFSNQLHFIENTDIEPIVDLVLRDNKETGIIQSYALRYLQRSIGNDTFIALTDISVEKETINTQIKNSLLIGSISILAFFLLSLFLAHWAVHPVEVAWKKQKQFIADASHELKTPLTVIISNAEMLQNNTSSDDKKNVRRMEHIHAEALRMKRLVEDMLTLAKSDSIETPGIYSIVDFSYITKSAVLMYEPMAFDEEKKLSYEIENDLSVMGDSQKLQQSIHILLDNAIKYSSSKGEIRVSLCQSEHKTVLLKVSNNGEPIPEDELERIFSRFFRRDSSRSEHESFGLGLSIAQSIINEHKGRIWAENDGEFGNSFLVSLPQISV